MRKDAAEGKFDAIVVHKFDRFARNRTDALAVKSLLRHDYGIKVFSASEPSEDREERKIAPKSLQQYCAFPERIE